MDSILRYMNHAYEIDKKISKKVLISDNVCGNCWFIAIAKTRWKKRNVDMAPLNFETENIDEYTSPKYFSNFEIFW